MEVAMSNHDSSTASVVVVMQEEAPSFLTNSVDLKKLHTDIKRHSKAAIDALVSMLDSTDPKIKLTAATKLLEFQVSVAKELSSDQMQRLIAEVKLVKSPKSNLVPVEDQKARPLVDFTTIRSVE
jgi:hypothetical protein